MAYVQAAAAAKPGGAPEPSAAAAAGAAAAALLQKQLAEDVKPSDKPSAGWVEHQTGDGRKFFYHEEKGVSTWEKPPELMTAEERKNNTSWREYRIWDGRVFYHNSETKVSCWSMPPEIRKLRGESAGIDETPLPETSAERRRKFWDHLRELGCDETWTWAAVDEATSKAPQAQELSVETRKQCFAELAGFCLRQKQLEVRDKQRNAASALERLIEDRFGKPEDLGTSYEEAASILEKEEPWQLIKSDLRRDEVFQTVMERLEEKHTKARQEKRAEQVARLQRLIGADAELRRVRLRWKDAAAILSKRDELHEEDPPLEALRVWSSLRDLKTDVEHRDEAKRRAPTANAQYREERKRRDDFIDIYRDMLQGERFPKDMPWAEFEGFVKDNPAYLSLSQGPGATAMEVFEEFQDDLNRGVSVEEAGLGFEIDLATPAPPSNVPAPPPLDPQGVKAEAKAGANVKEEPAAKRARVEPPAGVKMERGKLPAPTPPGLVPAKTEVAGAKAPQPSGLLAAKTEGAEESPLDQLLAAADAMSVPNPGKADKPAVSTPLTKEEVMDPSSKPPSLAAAKEEMAEASSDPLAVPSVPAAPKKAAAPPAAEPAAEAPVSAAALAASKEKFTAVQLMAKKVDDLRELCRARGLPVSGRKQELVDRLVEK